METQFHLRARAVIYHKGKILLNQGKGKSNTFLPGGHIEIGESIIATLEREAQEEFGREINVKEFLGVIEQSFGDENITHFEINHIFHVEIVDIEKNPEIHSLEDDSIFMWASLDELDAYNLFPISLRDFIKKWIAGDRSVWWNSNMCKQ